MKDTVSQSRAEIEAERTGAAPEISAWRAEQDALRRDEHREDAQALLVKQQTERLALETRTRKAVADGRQAISKRYKPAWRALYKVERDHVRHIKINRHGVFERAVHAFLHSRELGFGERLVVGEVAVFALSEKTLLQRVAAVTQAQRSVLSERQLGEVRSAAKVAWSLQHKDLKLLKDRHKVEQDVLDHKNKAGLAQLQNIRNAGLDEEIFKAQKTVKAKAAKKPRLLISAFSIKSLTGVWQVFRNKLSCLDQNQMAIGQLSRAVLDRPLTREKVGKIAAPPTQSRAVQNDYEHEI